VIEYFGWRYAPCNYVNSTAGGVDMGKYCEICKKGTLSGNKVSHSNRKSRRIWAPNIQSVRAVVNNSPKRINVCTRCLRSGKVQRALPKFSIKEMLEAKEA